jgi:hypothetical protein
MVLYFIDPATVCQSNSRGANKVMVAVMVVCSAGTALNRACLAISRYDEQLGKVAWENLVYFFIINQ